METCIFRNLIRLWAQLEQAEVLVYATMGGSEVMDGDGGFFTNSYSIGVSGQGGSASWSWNENVIAIDWVGLISGDFSTGYSELYTSNSYQNVDYEYSNNDYVTTTALSPFIGSGSLSYGTSIDIESLWDGDEWPDSYTVVLNGELDVQVDYTYEAAEISASVMRLTSVPEPASLGVLGMGLVFLLKRRVGV